MLDGAAWLTVVVRDPRVLDQGWQRMDPVHREAHLRLRTDLTRLARSAYVAALACLLVFVAGQSGNGSLASLALARALADDPSYRAARILRGDRRLRPIPRHRALVI